MTRYALRPDPVTGSLDDAEVVDEFKYGWQCLEQAITLWRLVDKDRADQIKDRAAFAAPDESRFYTEDLHELVRLLAGVDRSWHPDGPTSHEPAQPRLAVERFAVAVISWLLSGACAAAGSR